MSRTEVLGLLLLAIAVAACGSEPQPADDNDAAGGGGSTSTSPGTGGGGSPGAGGAGGGLTCDAGELDCDGDPSNGCETRYRTDDAHCGECGNACGTGMHCAWGACQPDPNEALTGVCPQEMQEHAGYLVWIDGCGPYGTVARMPSNGGTPEEIMSLAITDIAMNGTDLYFITSDCRIGTTPFDGGAITDLHQGSDTCFHIETDGTWIYYLEGPADHLSNLMRIPVAGGTPERLLGQFTFAKAAMALDPTNLYWIGNGSVNAMSLANPSQGHTIRSGSTFGGSHWGRAVAVNSSQVFWVGFSSVLMADKTAVDVSGEPLWSTFDTGAPEDIAADDDMVYWLTVDSEVDGMLLRQPPTPGAQHEVLAAKMSSARHTALTASRIYWASEQKILFFDR